MKKNRQSGQVIFLVLILLAIGSIIAIPALQLSSSSLKTAQIISLRSRDLYATDAAQEYVMWRLLYGGYTSQFTYDGQTDNFTVDVCGTPVKVSVIMRALATWRGVLLAKDAPIKPTITASPNSVTEGTSTTYTFTIKLEQIGTNTTQGLDAVYDVLPDGFTSGGYIAGSSEIRVDGGAWQAIGDPLVETSQIWPSAGSSFGGRVRMRWPNPYTYGQNNFASPIRDFTGGQIKEIRFRITNSLPNNSNRYRYYYSWAVLKPWNTVSGATGDIVVNNTSKSGTGYEGGLIDAYKSTNVIFIPPGQATNITYTVNMTSREGSTDKLVSITDYLPPGFYYLGPTSGITTNNPTAVYGPVNGVTRWSLTWNFSPQISIASGETKVLTFVARTSENVSGSYYNELNVVPNNPIPTIFSTPGISLTNADFNSGYTWNSAPVIVPAYDSSATSGNVTVNTNIAVTTGGVSISSYQIR